MTQQPASSGTAPAGFYPDRNGVQRYWDGSKWTDQTAAPAVPAPKRRRRWPWFLLAAVVLLVVIGVANAGKGTTPAPATAPAAASSSSSVSSATATTSAPAPEPAPKPAGLNTPVSDGQFQFTVTKVDCGHPSVGSGSLTKPAQGQFCFISVTVKNTGDKAQYLDASIQKAANAAGQQYSADSAAGIYLDKSSNTFLNQINPGNSVNGTIVFDIPKDAKLATLQLHDSAFSGGVTVSL